MDVLLNADISFLNAARSIVMVGCRADVEYPESVSVVSVRKECTICYGYRMLKVDSHAV